MLQLQLRAIIFDFDGTVLDTESACYTSWDEVYRRFDSELPMDLWKNVVGSAHGSFDPWTHLEEKLGRELEREQLEPARRKRELELIAEKQPLPGVIPLIEEAKAAGLAIGLATSSTRDWVEGHLRRLDLWEYFDAVATADDVHHVKPDPELYTLAAKKLHVAPAEAIAIEDSPTGALGAKRAGLVCLVVPNDVTKTYEFPMADEIWPTLADASVNRLAAVWRNARG